MFAAANGRHRVIEVLIERGADASLVTDVIDVPTLNKAIRDGFRKRIEDLRKARAKAAGDDVAQAEDEQKPKKSFFAKLFGWMIPGGGEEKAPPRRRREPFGDRVGKQGGMSALLFAARQGHTASVRVLLEAGADIDRVAEGSETSPLVIGDDERPLRSRQAPRRRGRRPESSERAGRRHAALRDDQSSLGAADGLPATDRAQTTRAHPISS